MINNLIIDFERLNKLTAHPNDDPSKSPGYGGPIFTYNITRKVLKEYIEIYTQYKINNTNITNEQYNNIVNTLKYNKILISPADIRDKKIKYILDENDEHPF